MAVTTSPRLGIHRWSDSAADDFSRAQLDADHGLLDSLTAIDKVGNHSARPAPGSSNRGMYYRENDTSRLYRSTGSAWEQILTRVGAAGAETTELGANPSSHDTRLNISTDDPAWRAITAVAAAAQTTSVIAVEDSDGNTNIALHGDGAVRFSDPSRPNTDYVATVSVSPKNGDRGIHIDTDSASTADIIRASVDGNTGQRFRVDFLGRVFLHAGPAPATPALGGMLYVSSSGVLHYLSAGGTDTVLAPF